MHTSTAKPSSTCAGDPSLRSLCRQQIRAAGLHLLPIVLAVLFGASLAWIAWLATPSPASAVVLPLLLSLYTRKLTVFFCAAAYQLTLHHGSIQLMTGWFDGSLQVALLAWFVLGLCGALPWALTFWPRPRKQWTLALSITAGYLVSLLPVFSVLQGGHPIHGWGHVLPGFGWAGVVLSVVLTYCVVWKVPRHTRMQVCIGGALLAAIYSHQIEPVQTHKVGHVHAANTAHGSPPKTDDQKLARYERIGAELAKYDRKPPAQGTVIIYPETALGRYDTSMRYVFVTEVVDRVRRNGVSVVLGREIEVPGQGFFNQAIYLPADDGEVQVVSQRVPALLSMWRPWQGQHYFTIDVGRDTLLDLGLAGKARVLICYEEYLPFVWFIDEFRGGHDFVIVMANAWSTDDKTQMQVQAKHTVAMASLFGRPLVRAENSPSK